MLCQKHGDILNSVKVLRDVSWHKAIKYKFDPVIGKMHEQYLEVLNAIIDSQKGEK